MIGGSGVIREAQHVHRNGLARGDGRGNTIFVLSSYCELMRKSGGHTKKTPPGGNSVEIPGVWRY
jgi:hypothetical protein